MKPKKVKVRGCRRCAGQGREFHGGLFFTTCRDCKGRGVLR
jgi:DnaJ-class molecular chaperone